MRNSLIKKILLVLVLNLMFFSTVSALIVSKDDVESGTYIIGKYMFTRTPNDENNYDGKLNTKRIMLASKTISGDTESAMIVYYKNVAGNWIDGLTGKALVAPSTFEIDVIDMNVEVAGPIILDDLSDYIVNKVDVYPSTYIIGNYMYTRDIDQKNNYDGVLNTQKIMLASKTLTGSKESDMIIYFKTASGNWIDALTGESIDAPTSFEISVINLRNQLEKADKAILGSSFNSKAKMLAGMPVGTTNFTENTNITKIEEVKSLPNVPFDNNNLISDDDSDIPIYAWYQNGTLYYFVKKYYSREEKIYLAESVNYMFDNFANVTSIDIDSFDTSNVTSMYGMFSGCKKLTSIDLSKFNTSNVTTMAAMFMDDASLTSLNLSNFDTSNVTNMSYMFSGCNSLTSLDLSSFNTNKVTTMGALFLNNASLTSLNISSFNTSNVTDMFAMFMGCESLTSLNISNLDTKKVTNMQFMFSSLKLTSLDLSNIDTSSVTSIDSMFNGSQYLKKLDLSTFDLSKVTKYNNVFYGNNSLEELVTPKINGDYEIALPKKMYDDEDNAYTSLTSTTPTETVLRIPNMISKGTDFNAKIKNMAGSTDATTSTVNENITAIRKADSLPDIEFDKDNILSMPGSSEALYLWYDEGTIYYYTSASKIYLPSEVTYMFANLPNLKTIDLSIFDSSQVGYMSYMFYNCSSLTSIDLSNFDLSNVRSATTVFYGTTSLVALNTPKVNANIEVILSKTLYDSDGKAYTKLTNELTNSILLESKTQMISGQMFNEKIKKMAGNSAATYSSINRSITEIRKSSTLVEGLTDDNVISTNDSSRLIYVWYDEGIIYYYTEASIVFLNNNASYMFNNLRSLTYVDLAGTNTSSVTNMGYMFDSCESLTTLDLSTFDMHKVNINMGMLNGLTSLTELKTPKRITGDAVELPHTMYDIDGASYTNLTSTTGTEMILKTEW